MDPEAPGGCREGGLGPPRFKLSPHGPSQGPSAPLPLAPGQLAITVGGDSFIHFKVLIKHLLRAYSSRRGQTRNWTSRGHPGGPQPAQRGAEAYRVGARKGVGRVPALVPGGGETGEGQMEGPGEGGGSSGGVGGPGRASEQGRGRCQWGCREWAWPGPHCGAIRCRSRAAPLPPPPEAAWSPPQEPQDTSWGPGREGWGAGGQRREVGCLSSCGRRGGGGSGLQGDERGQSRCWTDRGGGVVHGRPSSPRARTRTFPLGPGTSGAGASNRLLAGSAPA